MIIADLHIHSKHSRATSKQLDIKNLEKYAKIKGINLLGTGDFTHPLWIKELKSELKEEDSGVLKTKDGFPFLLQTEISLIYTQGNKGRRVHPVVLAPSLEVVEQINEALGKKGRLDYDGRPIFGMTSPEFVEMMKNISEKIEIIPAHCWTPWFGILGSKSGFDSLKECFQEQTKHIHAIETGLSSDPLMNWRLKQLDNVSIVSFSDLHSHWPWRIGREATVFDCKLSYNEIIKAIRENKIKETIEVDPSYGKYHEDGHRACNVHLTPKEAMKLNNICPVCKKPLTIGVMHRVEELADRAEGEKHKNAKPFRRLIPLSELIASVFGTQMATKKAWEEYYRILKAGKSELDILLNVSKEELSKVTNEKIIDAIMKNREGKLKIIAGYDGVYGQLVLDKEETEVIKEKVKTKNVQKGITDFF